MKKAFTLLFFVYLNSNISYCQLLSNPSLSAEDLELALMNPDHLRNILSEHKFIYTSGIEGKLYGFPGTNALVPYLEATRSGYWRTDTTQEFGSGIISRISIYDWKTHHSPQPDVVRTIIVFLNEDSINTEEINMFFERIKSNYTKVVSRSNESRYFHGEPYYIFTNNYNPRIEVRTGKSWSEPGWSMLSGYIVSFDLLN